MHVPAHVLELLQPLYGAGTTFSRSGDLISPTSRSASSGPEQRYLYKEAAGDSTQLVGEAASLRAINKACAEIAPTLLGSGTDEQGRKWMLSEWHELSSLGSDQQCRLAEVLAKMHLAPAPTDQRFGFGVPTCCGVTRQDNTEEESWAEFFGKRRISDMISRIADSDLERLGRRVQQRVVPALLGNLEIKPSILHGDLWSGNARFSKNRGAPIVFDPSSYYGHNEADLGITRMFGGFSSAFYERYHELVPKASPVDQYEQRLQLYEVYHHLNHTLMFGSSYKRGAIQLLQGLIDWADEAGI